MQLKMSEEIESFRAEVREFLKTDLPCAMAERSARAVLPTPDEDGLAWTKVLARKGWSVPYWPVEYGGTGWSALKLFVFEEECHAADAPVPAWQGAHMCGPVVYTFGTEEQKQRFLPPMRDGEHLWAQGFSEPGAGSDLASLRTSAVRSGDRYIVNGQKIWTSGAYLAHWGFFLVRTRTDGKPQEGISFLLIDLKSPGITIRRIPQMNGDAHLCEVFLDDVEVPLDNLVGEEGKGWSYAKFLLDQERATSASIHWSKRQLAMVRATARQERQAGVPLIEHPVFRQRLSRLEAELTALEWSVLRVLANEQAGYHPTAIASGLKVRGSELQLRVTELQTDMLGSKALRFFDYERVVDGDVACSPAWPPYVIGKTTTYLGARAATIYGGSLQIQKGIISKLAFGL
ncbi:MAG: acyl-CoA dehydrogenase family protein [Pseudomonadota bacterium]